MKRVGRLNFMMMAKLTLSVVLPMVCLALFSTCGNAKRGTVRIIAVGITYDGVSGLGGLGTGPVNDVAELVAAYSETLKSHGVTVEERMMLECSASGYGDFNVYGDSSGDTLIRNPNFPTKGNVAAALEAAAAASGENDLIVFIYSGHGANDGSLCLVGDNLGGTSDGHFPVANEESRLSPEELFGILGSALCKSVVIADSCHSGHFADEGGASAAAVFTRAATAEKVGVIAACGDSQTSNTFDVSRGDNVEMPDGSMAFANESHGFFSGFLIPFFGLEHAGETFRTFTAAELGSGMDFACRGTYREPARRTLALSDCFKSVKADVTALVRHCNEVYSGLNLRQIPELTCSETDFILYY